MKKYNSLLKKVKKQFGHSGTTLDSELQQWCDKHIPKFTKVVAYNKMPSLKKTQSCIVNFRPLIKGWLTLGAVYKNFKGGLVVYDSFGRPAKKILSKLDKGLKMIDKTETLNREYHRWTAVNAVVLGCCLCILIA